MTGSPTCRFPVVSGWRTDPVTGRPRRAGPASLRTWELPPPTGLRSPAQPSLWAGLPSVQDGLKVCGQGRVGCCLQGGQSGPREPPAQSGSGYKAATEVRPPNPHLRPGETRDRPSPGPAGTYTAKHPACRRDWGGHLRRGQAPLPCRGHGDCPAEARGGSGSGVRGRTRRWGAAGETEDEDPGRGGEVARPGWSCQAPGRGRGPVTLGAPAPSPGGSETRPPAPQIRRGPSTGGQGPHLTKGRLALHPRLPVRSAPRRQL